VLAAVAWGIAADLEGAARLAAANWLFWFMHSHLREGQRQYATLLERKADLPTHLRGRVLTGYAAMSFFQGDTETAAAASEEGLQLFQALGDTEGMALSLHHLALVANMRGESDRAAVLYKEILTLTRALSDNWLTGVTIHNQGE
jgi:hypothetical protein